MLHNLHVNVNHILTLHVCVSHVVIGKSCFPPCLFIIQGEKHMIMKLLPLQRFCY